MDKSTENLEFLTDGNVNHKCNERHTPYAFCFFFVLIFAGVEWVGGVYTHSLALLSDAGHMFFDAFALGLAWFAAKHAQKTHAKKHISGMSLAEIMVSIINALLMLVIVVFILIAAVSRYKNPVNVAGAEVMLIAFLGLIVNVIVAKRLHQGHSHRSASLNHHAAFLHVLGDLLGSLAAIVAGLVIYFTGYMPADPILSIFISLLILIATLKLIKEIWHTLFDSQYQHINKQDHHG